MQQAVTMALAGGKGGVGGDMEELYLVGRANRDLKTESGGSVQFVVVQDLCRCWLVGLLIVDTNSCQATGGGPCRIRSFRYCAGIGKTSHRSFC